ncbi:MAG: NADH-quinone oxidoreductase subunit L [Planctomycetaceae bacterium]
MPDLSTLQIIVVVLPLLGALASVVLGRTLGPRAHLPALVTLGGSCLAALLILASMANDHSSAASESRSGGGVEHITTLWNWATIDDAAGPSPLSRSAADPARPLSFSIPIQLRLDPLTASMLAVVTFVGLLVAIYSIGYMHGDPGYPRFFALVSLFVFAMTMLVSDTNFLIVYVFWEGVGACSYLLIGFWFAKPSAAAAAKKAFLVNRVGDFGLAIAAFLIWTTYGTLDFHDSPLPDGGTAVGLLGTARLQEGAAGGIVAGTVGAAICLLLLLAACGKSAQVPLHVWLPDAMEGPTPASSLIHAATMVTAGVYLVARSAPLFAPCPGALAAVSLVGGITALVAGLVATVQNDLKRVLAYSTISQLGYMFVSLGTGTLLGFTAAIFHLVTHAFFKALLFMGAGSVMHSMGGVIDMRRFGGLRRLMPITAATFLVGAFALAGVPPFAGFFSKDEILAAVHEKSYPAGHGEHHESSPVGSSPMGRAWFTSHASPAVGEITALDALDAPATWRIIWWMAITTAALTAFYTFRAVFMTFTGPERVPDEAYGHGHGGGHSHGGTDAHDPNASHGQASHVGPHESPRVMTLPLLILAAASAIAGWWLFSTHALADFLAATPSFAAPSIASTAVPHAFHFDIAIQGTLAAAVGIAVAALGHFGRRSDGPQMERFLGPFGWLFAQGFLFDPIYRLLVVRPLAMLATLADRIDRHVVDGLVHLVAGIPVVVGTIVRRLQSGLLQRYAVAGAAGVILIVLALAWRLRG